MAANVCKFYTFISVTCPRKLSISILNCSVFRTTQTFTRKLSIVKMIRTDDDKISRLTNDWQDQLFNYSANGKVDDVKRVCSNRYGKSHLDVTNSRGWTALMMAARNGHTDIVRLLISSGASKDQTNKLGQSAYDIASFWGHASVMKALRPGGFQHPGEIRQYFNMDSIDRASHRRKDYHWLKSQVSDQSTLFQMSVNGLPVVRKSEIGKLNLAEFNSSTLKTIIPDIENIDKHHIMFVGVDHDAGNRAIFGINITRDSRELLINMLESNIEKYKEGRKRYSAEKQLAYMSNISQSLDNIRPDQLDALVADKPELERPVVMGSIREAFKFRHEHAARAGLVHSLVDWHQRCRYCASCGHESSFAEAGYKRQCTNTPCQASSEVSNVSYPRLDPTIISAVVSPTSERILLAKSRRFRGGNMYSCLAGFMEPSESLESACRREIFEETGIEVGRVDYIASQSWPFPTQLMIGTLAHATSELINVDTEELVDARWFTRQDVVKMMMNQHPESITVPPYQALAHTLIKTFLHHSAEIQIQSKL